MNQFVPQLMLGNPLCNSTGPPLYKPIWHKFDTWVFGAQYFFEIFNKTANKTQAHAATGELFPTREGEVIYTSFDLDKSTWSWSLTMGVRGDATRVSTLVVPAPFMGLIKEETSSWSEPVYAKAVSNACWELYGIASAENVSVCASQLLLAPTNIHNTPARPRAFSLPCSLSKTVPTLQHDHSNASRPRARRRSLRLVDSLALQQHDVRRAPFTAPAREPHVVFTKRAVGLV